MSLKTFSYLNYNLKYCLYKAIDSNNVRDIILHVCVLNEFGVLLLSVTSKNFHNSIFKSKVIYEDSNIPLTSQEKAYRLIEQVFRK